MKGAIIFAPWLVPCMQLFVSPTSRVAHTTGECSIIIILETSWKAVCSHAVQCQENWSASIFHHPLLQTPAHNYTEHSCTTWTPVLCCNHNNSFIGATGNHVYKNGCTYMCLLIFVGCGWTRAVAGMNSQCDNFCSGVYNCQWLSDVGRERNQHGPDPPIHFILPRRAACKTRVNASSYLWCKIESLVTITAMDVYCFQVLIERASLRLCC